MRLKFGTIRAGILALGVIALSAPAFAQTNTDSGTKTPDAQDVSKKTQQGSPGVMGGSAAKKSGSAAQKKSSMPRASTTGSGQPDDSKGTQINRDQLGMKPGGKSGAPANPCTAEQKAQDRC